MHPHRFSIRIIFGVNPPEMVVLHLDLLIKKKQNNRENTIHMKFSPNIQILLSMTGANFI